ncbi:hypothetical protein GOP47_0003692 [Adiantum capillus-veneris]|uniref:Uncharacterized protein n=1 Tax=Adiantum capillus-veneris TaxID=13818 RepID=A0A9D4V6L6_ADICA|nr:hypothetical protein GOP47_0003692 [Adiantum capillus-veneris]
MQEDGTPLREGKECGPCYLYQMLNVYIKKEDVVVQYGDDIGGLALLGSHMGRYFTIMESSEVILDELLKIMKHRERN